MKQSIPPPDVSGHDANHVVDLQPIIISSSVPFFCFFLFFSSFLFISASRFPFFPFPYLHINMFDISVLYPGYSVLHAIML